MVRPQGAALGTILGTANALMWGTQFTVTKVLYRHLDAFAVTTVRYGVGGLVLLAILLAVEGPAALRLGVHTRRAWVLGGVGVIASTLVSYIGLEHARPQDVALMVALQPLITAVGLRLTRKAVLPRSTALAIAVALAGSLVVIAHGDPHTFVDGGIGWGVGLSFLAQVAWVVYTVRLTSLESWSVLRMTAITATTGGAMAAAITGVAVLAGFSHPRFQELGTRNLLLVWMVLGPTVAAVFCWNKGRMLLGAQNIALFMYLMLVVTFVAEAVRGYEPSVAEVAAAAAVLAALVGDNFVQRRARARSGGGA